MKFTNGAWPFTGKRTARNALASAAAVGLLVAGCGTSTVPTGAAVVDSTGDEVEVFEESVPRADCGAGSLPETDLQGRVPIEDREGGRSQEGYRCNLELKSQAQYEGASWQFAWYEDCAYYDTVFTGGSSPANENMGTQALDVSDPAAPMRTDRLVTPAMVDPWESLKVNQKRGLLAADAGWNIAGPLFFDVYDLKGDCRHPALLSSTPTIIAGHEGNWAPDGLTYYVGTGRGIVDVSNPSLPQPIATTDGNGSGHGLSLSADGNRMYAVTGIASTACSPNGLVIFDTSQIQARKAAPAMPVVGTVCWADGATAQHAQLVHYGIKPFVIFVDEGGKGAGRIIDVSDEKNPVVVSKLKLEIHQPENDPEYTVDTANNGGFGYEGHYCTVDREQDPTAVACSYFQSGIRVFDIRNPYRPREIAYFNPPAQVGKAALLKGSEHAHSTRTTVTSQPDLTADWCTAQVRFVRERGELWTSCQDNGFMILKFTNGAWPLD